MGGARGSWDIILANIQKLCTLFYFPHHNFISLQMFVRLFVDENLDRHVPISKQPKEKIQAIIDSCTRQFPEYSVRSRKRIRTYLKSCRRTKRSREQAGLDINNVSFRFKHIPHSFKTSHVTLFSAEAHPASPDQRAGGAAAGPRL